MRIVLTTVLSLVLHLTLGWAWTLGAGILGGALADRNGWFVGAAGVSLGWSAIAVYSIAVAPASSQILLDVLGQLAGNIPGAVIVAITVLLGALLGGLGGIIGTQLTGLTGEEAPDPAPVS